MKAHVTPEDVETVDIVMFFAAEESMLRNHNVKVRDKADIWTLPLFGTAPHVEKGTGLEVFPTLAPLSGYANLEEVSVYACRLEELSGLAGHPSLRRLEFGWQVELGEPAQLARLDDLEEVRIAVGSPLVPHLLEHLPRSVRWEIAVRGDQGLADLERLSACRAHEIVLDISDLDLDAHPNLVSGLASRFGDRLVGLRLDAVGYDRPAALRGLKGLSSLRDLALRAPGNRPHQLTALPPLPGTLEALEVSRASLTGLEGVGAAPGLRILVANLAKELASLDALAGCPDLQELRVRGTRVRDLAPLADAPDLRYLFVEKSRVRSLEGLEACVELRQVTCHSTRVRSLAPLAEARRLTWLDVAGCPIDDWHVLASFPHLRLLDTWTTSLDRLPFHPDLDGSHLVMRWGPPKNMDRTAARTLQRQLEEVAETRGITLSTDGSDRWIRRANHGRGPIMGRTG